MSESANQNLSATSRKALTYYHSATQLRFDTWHRLEHYTTRLNERHGRKADIDRYRQVTRDALVILETIEEYTAFPSREDFQLLWRL